MKRSIFASAALTFALLASAIADAQVTSNFQSYPIGERASGMGGAAVALSEEAAGAYYNPAGAAFATDDSLAVTANIYGIVGGNYNNLLGPGRDFSFSSLNISPNAAASLIHLGKGKDGKPPIWVFCFGVFSPNGYMFDQRNDSVGGAANVNLSVNDSSVIAGPSFAVRIKDRVSIGFGASAVFSTLTYRRDFTIISNLNANGFGQDYVHTFQSLDETNIGLLFSLGVQWHVNERWSLGLSIRSPTAPLYGSGTYYVRGIVNTPDVAPTATMGAGFHAYSIDTQRILPTRVSVGLAYKTGRLTLAADLQMYMPHPYDEVSGKGFTIRVENDFMANANLGLEYNATKHFLIRAGAYTDASSGPVPTLTNSGVEQVHLFGGTFGLGWESAHTSNGVSVIAAGGPISSRAIDLNTGLPFITDGTEWRVYVVYATSYHF